MASNYDLALKKFNSESAVILAQDPRLENDSYRVAYKKLREDFLLRFPSAELSTIEPKEDEGYKRQKLNLLHLILTPFNYGYDLFFSLCKLFLKKLTILSLFSKQKAIGLIKIIKRTLLFFEKKRLRLTSVFDNKEASKIQILGPEMRLTDNSKNKSIGLSTRELEERVATLEKQVKILLETNATKL